jgi:hypothetical protein
VTPLRLADLPERERLELNVQLALGTLHSAALELGDALLAGRRPPKYSRGALEGAAVRFAAALAACNALPPAPLVLPIHVRQALERARELAARCTADDVPPKVDTHDFALELAELLAAGP